MKSRLGAELGEEVCGSGGRGVELERVDEGGVGLQFEAWPMIESTLMRRRDFTRLMANHKDTSGGFYERERGEVILHFLFQEGDPRTWYVHFDLYSPVHSPGSVFRHLRHEFLGKVKPDWQMIAARVAPDILIS